MIVCIQTILIHCAFFASRFTEKHPLSEYTFKLSSCITPNKLYSFIFASLILDTYPYG